MEVREGLYYSKDHEWVRVMDDRAYVGITDYAQHSLGDIVFLELPDQDSEYVLHDRLGVIESVKAAADIHCPLSGRVLAVNSDLEDAPESVNSQPYESWIAVLSIADRDQLAQLMSAEEYRKLIKSA